MALQNPDVGYAGGLDSSPQALMKKLDKLLVDCTQKEVAKDSIYGVDYMIGLEELKRVRSYILTFSNSLQVKCTPLSSVHNNFMPMCEHLACNKARSQVIIANLKLSVSTLVATLILNFNPVYIIFFLNNFCKMQWLHELASLLVL